MPITIRQLAKLAGTSPSTVSRALAGSPLVAESTRDRIRELAETHDYTPNALAQGLATQTSRLIGLLVPDITNPFFAEWAHAAELAASQQSYAVVLGNTMRRTDMENLHLRTFTQLRVAGLVVISLDTRNPTVQALATRDLPVVFCQPPGFTSAPVEIVTGHDRRGARIATSHLLELGRRRIAHLAGSDDAPVTALRVEGWSDALREAGVPVDHGLLEGTSYSETGGYEATHRLLDRRPDVDAIFAANDLIAIGAMQAVHERGLRIPDDIAIVGMDDIRLARLVRPALTTIRLAAADIGRRATEALMTLIADPAQPRNVEQIEPTLVVRESTVVPHVTPPPRRS